MLPKALGVTGVLWAGPVADGLAFLLALALIIYDIEKLKKHIRKEKAEMENVESENQNEKSELEENVAEDMSFDESNDILKENIQDDDKLNESLM